MNVRKLKEKLITTLIGGFIFVAWVIYAILTDFNFIAFITNPTVISVLLILSVPLAFLLADLLWGDKQ
jgi:DMSO/TMAO reductase YedYZ heme-binding membrane subunit